MYHIPMAPRGSGGRKIPSQHPSDCAGPRTQLLRQTPVSWCFLESPRSSGFLDAPRGSSVFIVISKTAEIWLPCQTSQLKGFLSCICQADCSSGTAWGHWERTGFSVTAQTQPSMEILWKGGKLRDGDLVLVLGKLGFPGSATVLCVSPWSPPLMPMMPFHQKLVSRS